MGPRNVVNGLAERGLDARSVEQENVKPGKPLVMTMHRAKGLEFTHVLLFGMHEGAVPRVVKDYEERRGFDQSNTRARHC